MNTVLHRSNTRGVADHGWLNSHHTFSFANYFNPERMGFGTLRVINDDVVSRGKGFDTHPHQNMEIISVPLRGCLRHKDTIGNEHVIKKGEIQAMSAGTGLLHSEYNNSNTEDVNFLQIWVLPEFKNIAPSYSQQFFEEVDRSNKLQLIVSPDGRENSVLINQRAYFSLTNLEKGKDITYNKYEEQNGVYIFLLEGDVKISDIQLSKRDGLGIIDEDHLNIIADTNSSILIMEVPMTVERRR